MINRVSNLAELTKKARLQKDLSQGKLAKALGYESAQFVSNIERGLADWPLPALRPLSKLLELGKNQIKYAYNRDCAELFEEAFK